MSQKVFLEGAYVTVNALKKQGVITRVLPGGSYVVAVGSFTLTVKHNEVEPCTPCRPKSIGGPGAASKQLKRRGRTSSSTLDLHGLTVEQAVRALETWLNQAVLDGCKQLKVIHGLGSGRIQQAVHDTLEKYSVVRAFRINDANPGATDIFIG